MNLTELFALFIGLIAALITAFVIPYIKAKFTAEQLSTLTKWVDVGVSAAEQIFSISGQGDAKKQYVLNFLESKGYTVNTDEVDTLIEAAVNKLAGALKG